jgi:uncharacterized protein (TIGR02266 family)
VSKPEDKPHTHSEKRYERRVQVNREFSSIEEFITEYVSDISRSGVFIRSDVQLPVGTKVDLCFTVIVGDFETIEGIGEVVRVVSAGEGAQPGMGVVFTELTSDSQRLVDGLLEGRAKR